MASMVTAAVLHEHGAPLRVEERSLAEPGPDEVVVDLAFGGVNPVDRYTAEGKVAPDGPLPRVLGGEASGHLDGRPVLVAGTGLGAARDGVWATRVVVPTSAVVDLPDGVSLQAAAGMGVAGLTAYNTVRMAEVTADDRVLVLGASGGVGLTLLSYVASTGATVWGQTGSPDKAAHLTADRVVVTDADGLADAVADLRPTVVLDCLGGGFTGAAIEALQPGGRHVVYGTSAGADIAMNLQSLYRKGIRLLWYAGLGLSAQDRRAGLEGALAELAAGRMRIEVGRVVPLAEVNDALVLLNDRAVVGKVLLDLR